MGEKHSLSIALDEVVEPALSGADLESWAAAHRDPIAARLRESGAILFRGFPLALEDLARTAAAIGGELQDYSIQWTPRSALGEKVFTSTEYPAGESIPLHNEMSYAAAWPRLIFFFCAVEPEQGGETPIADSRRIWQRMDPAIRERFASRGVMYVRHFGGGLDIPWQTAFHTASRDEAGQIGRAAGMRFEWLPDQRLRTTQRGPGAIRHPQTGEMVWFNQAHLFHIAALAPEIREILLARCGPERLPRHALYGDGSPIEASVIAEIQAVCESEAAAFRWRRGDLLLLDNMLTAHGRRPFSGPRRIAVCMAGRECAR